MTIIILTRYQSIMEKTEPSEDKRQKHIERCRAYYRENRANILAQQKIKREGNKELYASNKKKHYEANRQSILDKCKDYTDRNREKIKESRRKYRESNKEKITKRKQDYYVLNKERLIELSKTPEFIERRKSWSRSRYQDPIINLIARCRSRTFNAFSSKGYKKEGATAEMIGCSWCHLKAHIEKQFSKGMKWENKNQWHIDHIVPLSSSKTKEEVANLCHFSNLRPMSAAENNKKRSRIITCQPELLLKHK